jgi:phosphoribosylformylglycinamidine cyclo-ligase
MSRKDAYAKAGVDISAGNALVERIKPHAKSTARKGANAALGGFGAFFDIKACGYKDPIIVSSNDGVGTKLKIAIEANRHDHIGIDCVAMCVNDLVVSGAEPLFFLDYYATGKLNVAVAEKVIAGVARGCKESNCALVGGETAELPGLYSEGDYDLAGFSVGAVERNGVINGSTIAAGDVVIGLASSGAHSNGYSLIRKIVKDKKLSYSKPASFNKKISLGEALLKPTKLYVVPLLNLIKKCDVKGMAHITGGGLLENIPRVIPKGFGVNIDVAAWPMPDLFKWLATMGGIPPKDMIRTFNCGIGMVVIVPRKDVAKAQALLKKAKIANYVIGGVGKRGPKEEVMRFSHLNPEIFKWRS